MKEKENFIPVLTPPRRLFTIGSFTPKVAPAQEEKPRKSLGSYLRRKCSKEGKLTVRDSNVMRKSKSTGLLTSSNMESCRHINFPYTDTPVPRARHHTDSTSSLTSVSTSSLASTSSMESLQDHTYNLRSRDSAVSLDSSVRTPHIRPGLLPATSKLSVFEFTEDNKSGSPRRRRSLVMVSFSLSQACLK